MRFLKEITTESDIFHEYYEPRAVFQKIDYQVRSEKNWISIKTIPLTMVKILSILDEIGKSVNNIRPRRLMDK